MARQGNALTEVQVRRIISLLSLEEITLSEIAQRMGCSKSAVVSINRRFQIRDYAGHRSVWAFHEQRPELVSEQV